MRYVMMIVFLVAAAITISYGDDLDFRKVYNVAPGGTLYLNSDYGDLKISTSGRNEVIIEVKGLEEENFKNLTVTQEGNSIRVSYRNRGRWADDIEFNVVVPAQYSLDIKTSAGNIDLLGNITGNVKLNTSGGDIETQSITGNLDAYTSGGNVKPGNVTGVANIKTAGGNIVTGNISGGANFSTSGGNISTGNMGGTVKLVTAGGDIVSGTVNGTANIKTSGGNINIVALKGNSSVSTAGGSISVGSTSSKLEAKTSGGDLYINSLGSDANLKTSAGEITVKFSPSNNGKVFVKNSAGDVKLVFPNGTKAYVQANISAFGWDMEDQDVIRSDFPGTVDRQGGKVITKTQVNGGGGASVTVELDMGTLSLKKN